ncbi:TfoX/Sxy family protein [Halobium salinum]|uniref:TfoX/Sxy family protein n=1 Tax=Halobium salinum TaxID=1364940 RepID=A0ABD5PBD6_9EURY|nr:TfoX/Sxy family protein [Halobium salinum]
MQGSSQWERGTTVTVSTLRDAVAAAVAEWPGVTTKRTFGCPAFLARGEVFALVSEQGLTLTRLDADDRRLLAETRDARPFRASGLEFGRWVTVPVESGDLEGIQVLLRASYEATLRE